MKYRSIREFATHDPVRLRSDLQRQSQALEDAFADANRDFLQRWRIVKVTDALYQAAHGELILAGYNTDTVIVLPASSEQTGGLAVRVVFAGGSGSITVQAPSGQTVNSVETQAFGGSYGFKEYVDDGLGAWWGSL